MAKHKEREIRQTEEQLTGARPDSSSESLGPAIDGPPSSEQIRAYTEQMKRSSIFGNNSRTQTLSSGSSSFRSSREGSIGSAENISLSRKSSHRSHSSTMPGRTERPDSVQIFAKSIFSRGGRKQRRGTTAGLGDDSPSLVSLEEGGGSAKERYFGKSGSRHNSMSRARTPAQDGATRIKHNISGPYNFQHVAQVRQDHIPTLGQAGAADPVTEFANLRASQALTGVGMKSYKNNDLHFENFSSVNFNEGSSFDAERSSILLSPTRKRNTLRKSITPPQMYHARSHDNLRRRTPPPRPPRSPLLPPGPQDLPERISYDAFAFEQFPANIERPPTTQSIRGPPPALYSPPPPPLQPAWSPQQDYFSERPASHAITTPGDEAWPLTASTVDTFKDLADVPEAAEEEDAGMKKRRSRMSSVINGELRFSQSVPSLRLKALDQSGIRPGTALSTMLEDAPEDKVVETHQPLSPKFAQEQDSWEDDIDYIYEHEAEADCDFQWERTSVGNESNNTTVEARSRQPSPYAEQVLEEGMDFHLNDERQIQPGRFRPSLLVPAPYEIPELSPMSNNSVAESDPHTPANLLRPAHLRKPSHASSFKESHGFTLSPTLLIPTDFAAQMDQEALYDDFMAQHDMSKSTSATIFPQEAYQAVSPIEETLSSTASFRSSDFSRGSARSSSSTRFSNMNIRASQDSGYMQGRVASLSQEHHSFGSSSSLPDLVASSVRRSDVDLPSRLAELNVSVDQEEQEEPILPPEFQTPAPGPSVPLARKRAPTLESVPARKGINHFAPAPPMPVAAVESNTILSPVVEGDVIAVTVDEPVSSGGSNIPSHGRNVSVPLLSSPNKEFKGRARASSTAAAARAGEKRRGSYMLFPQI
ncbi:hypothetical protein F5884DRAFT_852044 [Xylogone sp. PMI_703]|nr:hypothetical protein F5884DRAFT_852044 [Xylogone sp. PMI_703]